MKKTGWIIFILIAGIAAGAAISNIRHRYPETSAPITQTAPPSTTPSPPPATGGGAPATSTPVAQNPKTLNLPVPFMSQAPTANWDQLHNEACEEAVSYMAAAYFGNSADAQAATIKPEAFEQALSDMTKWEDGNFGYHLDTTAEETAAMMEQMYGLRTEIISDYSADDIKSALAKGRLVIVAENGQKLGNPNYKQPGPIYHMLLIRGYTSEGFVTNDPGTRRGQNYFYTFDTLYGAAANWDHAKNTIDATKKIAIVVWK